MPTDVADHRREVWSDRGLDQERGLQATPQTSLELGRRHAPDRSSAVIDVRGGASHVAAHLLELQRLVDPWHDRAVLHSFVRPARRRADAQRVLANLRPASRLA